MYSRLVEEPTHCTEIMPKVSVIIPVYGVEKYIERCARSLFEQTLDDMEYLFIDDCTPDKSIEILRRVLEEYPQRKSQVIIHRMAQNSGQALVRKWGIDNSTGDYIIHCDSDDWVDCNMYRDLYVQAVETESDVVVCDYFITDCAISKRIKACDSVERNKLAENILYHKNAASLCNKLIKRDLYINRGVTYPKCSMAEDITLVVQLLWYCKSITYIEKAYYYYYSNNESISKNMEESRIVKRFQDSISNISILCNFLREKRVPASLNTALIYAINHQRENILPLIDKKEYYEMWATCFPEINNPFLIRWGIPVSDKLRFIMAKLKIYPFIRKIRKL